MSSTIRSSCCDEVKAVRTISFWSAAIEPCISRSSMGTMPLRGVRISWLMVARNSRLSSNTLRSPCRARATLSSRRCSLSRCAIRCTHRHSTVNTASSSAACCHGPFGP